MTRCGASFNITEMLALIKGDFSKIDNFAPRIKEILSADLKDSQLGRKQYAQKAVDALGNNLQVPVELKSKMVEGFEPNEGICEILSERLPELINIVLDSSDDQVLSKG